MQGERLTRPLLRIGNTCIILRSLPVFINLLVNTIQNYNGLDVINFFKLFYIVSIPQT